MSAAFDFVNALIDYKLAPVFTAPPVTGKREFARPTNWSSIDHADSRAHLDRFEDGYAVCAVLGERVAVLDVDPRNGGDVEQIRQLLAGLDVRVFAEVATPGGGRHFYVNGHPELPTAHDLVGFPGVDLQSHGSNVYLPGTKRPHYGDKGYAVVVDDLDALADGGDPDGAEQLVGWVATHRAVGRVEAFDPCEPWSGKPHDPREAAYVAGAMRKLRGKVQEAPKGQRNTKLFEAAMACGNYVAGAGMDEGEAVAQLLAGAVANGLVADDGEAAAMATIRFGMRNGKARPRAVPLLKLPVTVLDDGPGTGGAADAASGSGTVTGIDSDVEAAFWASRDELTHVHTFARARRASPWGVLGATLARVVVATGPVVVLPPLVGSSASLNLFAAIVGRSGGGKGAALGAATDALSVGHVESCPIGSGEGLTHAFMRRVKSDVEQYRTAVLANVGEVDTLTALSSRQGSTLLSVLRQAYMGEEFGFHYADPTKRLTVPAHSYRLCMIVGVQPARAAGLLDDADGGTPQRFLWLPATDRDAPDVAPDLPEPRAWHMPSMPRRGHYDRSGRYPVPVCDSARVAIDENRLAGLRNHGDPLDGHALLTRLKVAAALGLLDGRLEVSEEDWRLAGTVMAVSDATRAGVVAQLADAQRRSNRARGDAEAERAVQQKARIEEHDLDRVQGAIRRRLASAGDQGMQHSPLRRAVTSRDRHLFEDAVEQLVRADRVTVEQIAPDARGGGGVGCRYRLRT